MSLIYISITYNQTSSFSKQLYKKKLNRSKQALYLAVYLALYLESSPKMLLFSNKQTKMLKVPY